MSVLIFVCFAIYTALLFLVTGISSRKANNDTFFTGNKKSPWYVVAYGMIGASLSGVTFMSVPGYVGTTQFTYFGLIIGYMIGYILVAFILLPLYYRLNLVSIYAYLEERFGRTSRKTGSFFFIISRLIGSALRMYIVVYILYEFVFQQMGVAFWVPAAVFVLLIIMYTIRGGIKTVVWTDTLQTTFMLVATVLCFLFLLREVDLPFFDFVKRIQADGYAKVFETNWRLDNFFVKQILSGIFITITMTGLDQDMMQKNLTCKNLKESQKNMLTFSTILLLVNVLFLFLGAALLYYVHASGFELPSNPDRLFPSVAFEMSSLTAVFFVIGLVAAGYSSADGTLTALTTTVCFDFLGFGTKDTLLEKERARKRKIVHILFGVLYLFIIILFRSFHKESLIKTIFEVAGFTYGPLLGLYVFGLFSKREVRDSLVPLVAILAPVLSYLLKLFSKELLFGYVFGFEILLLNGFFTYLGLHLISIRPKKPVRIYFQTEVADRKR